MFDNYFEKPKSKLIGKFAYITDKESMYYQEWAKLRIMTVKYITSLLPQDSNQEIIFNRNQFKVPQRHWLRFHAEEIKRRNIAL